MGGGPRVVVSTAAFHARVRGSVPGLKETKMFLPHRRVKVSIVGSFRDREVACSASDRQGSNFESCVWRTVSSQSSHHPQEVLLAQFSLDVHKGGLKPDSFHFYHKVYSRKIWFYLISIKKRRCPSVASITLSVNVIVVLAAEVLQLHSLPHVAKRAYLWLYWLNVYLMSRYIVIRLRRVLFTVW